MARANDDVRVVCWNGHPQSVWGMPMMAQRGSGAVRWWGSPLVCGKCGAPCKASA